MPTKWQLKLSTVYLRDVPIAKLLHAEVLLVVLDGAIQVPDTVNGVQEAPGVLFGASTLLSFLPEASCLESVGLAAVKERIYRLRPVGKRHCHNPGRPSRSARALRCERCARPVPHVHAFKLCFDSRAAIEAPTPFLRASILYWVASLRQSTGKLCDTCGAEPVETVVSNCSQANIRYSYTCMMTSGATAVPVGA